ncbi:TerB family tellurite resistance protein [Cognatiyoonia sp. IB215182]|uniref:TerB family tellurite resistance protein n=1 Tax=Cognatiyoonia sp. IB215182 TaxID=3097353 RepID=UPI002A116978|nr:TerB family tellurite resistance protein [Cognatiyoonia sp. IB215182]MDX8351784.1 TerB family tellurite resistance protein [Cognatiyoonia sp. IB215182]
MRARILLTLFLALISYPAHAFTNDTGYFDGLEFVADTTIPGPDINAMSLCYVTRDLKILGLTLTSDITGYALADDGCVSEPLRPFSEEQMITAQSLELIPADIPAQARNDLTRNLKNYGLWAAIGLALIAVIIRRIKSLLGYDLRGPLRAKASSRILTTMCYAGSAAGVMASNDIAIVAQAARRLTRRNYQPQDIIRIADHLDPGLDAQDYIDFGRGLRDREKDIMMQGVLYVAMANGRMLPGQYAFSTELAHGLGMPAEDFRRVMKNAMIDLDRFPPTPSTS